MRELGARLPDTADGALEVGPSRFEALRLRVSLAGAAATSAAQIVEGRVVYESVLPATDRVIAASAESLEELLVLQGEHAPRAFTWNIQLPPGIAHVRGDEGGGLRFEDAKGTPQLLMPRPVSYDARGALVPLTVAWSDETRTLTARLPDGALAFPVVVDPRYDIGAWKDISTRTPETRTQGALAYDSRRQEMVLFGGFSPATNLLLNDTWVLNTTTRVWTRRYPAHSPPARAEHVMTYDAADAQVVLFGGDASKWRDDTWTWDGTDWTERMPSVRPPGRNRQVMAFDPDRGELVMFGGNTVDLSVAADTWVWQGGAWTERTGATRPGARFGGTMAYDPARKQLILYGGAIGSGLTETWAWNGANTTWSKKTPAVTPPDHDGTLFFDTALSRVVHVRAGIDAWSYDAAGDTWAKRTTIAAAPTHGDMGYGFDTTLNTLVGFGGSDASLNATRDLFFATLGGTIWSQITVPTPTPRTFAAMAYDEARHEAVMFGGAVAQLVPRMGYAYNANQETWIWNTAASRWTLRAPSQMPPKRYGHQMVFDATLGVVVMFGGASSLGYLGDTWTWDGTTWTARTPTLSPTPRVAAAAAFDSARNETVLFGGNNQGTNYDDTWTFGGTRSTWTQRTLTVRPSGRLNAAMAFDAERGQAVLFGGGTGIGAGLGDTWTWDGSAWTLRAPAVSRWVASPTRSPSSRRPARPFFSAAARVLTLRACSTSTTLGRGTARTGARRAPTRRRRRARERRSRATG